MEFREKLAQSESGGRYDVVNDEGFTGKYQFGLPRLRDYMTETGSEFTMEQFRTSPELQETVQAWHEQDILDYAEAFGLDDYYGKTVGGVEITPTSVLGMAHLGGKSGMRKFIESGGEYNPSDSNNTSLRDYGRKFSGSGSTELPDRPETTGGVEAALKTLIESDGDDARGEYKNVMRGLASLTKAFDTPDVVPVKSSAKVSRGRGGNALERFEGLGSMGGYLR